MELVAPLPPVHQDFTQTKEDPFCSFNSSISKVQSKQELFSHEDYENGAFRGHNVEGEQESFAVAPTDDTVVQSNLNIFPAALNESLNAATPSPLPSNVKEPVNRDKSHIQYLLNRLPELDNVFHIHRKIGEGTFSSVFLATLKTADNDQDERQFAIKHLVPTTLPSRTERELRCLQEIGGRDNVVGVDLCLRKGDCVVFVMPYLPHKRFIDYVLDLDVEETREYMKNLLLSLRRVHSFNVIHRDVKPSNFLYDRENKKFLLVDFGLSQTLNSISSEHKGIPVASDPARKRKRQEENCDEVVKNEKNVMQCTTPESVEYKHRRLALHPLNEMNRIQPERILQPLKKQRIEDGINQKSNTIEQASQKHKRSPSKLLSENKCPAKSGSPVKSPLKVRTPVGLKKSPYRTWSPSKQKSPAKYRSPVKHKSPGKHKSPNKLKTPNKYGMKSPNSNCNNNKSRTPARLAASKSKAGFADISIKKKLFSSTDIGIPQRTDPSSRLSQGFVKSPFTAKKFQNLVPDRARVSSGGSSFVRVQNSQVVKPMSPLASEQQIKQVMFSKPSPKLLGAHQCMCSGKPQVCTMCMMRKAHTAPRAGTPGFRPPEVLLKYAHQTTAVDMWATGVIMLCILSGCYPFFRSPDDVMALAEIMTVFGTENIKKTALHLGRTVLCSQQRAPLDLKKLCERLRRLRKERKNQQQQQAAASGSGAHVVARGLRIPTCPHCENSIDEKEGCLCRKADVLSKPADSGAFPDSAYHLLERLLDLNPDSRITASEALEHPFITGK